jgi:hypothetical protein
MRKCDLVRLLQEFDDNASVRVSVVVGADNEGHELRGWHRIVDVDGSATFVVLEGDASLTPHVEQLLERNDLYELTYGMWKQRWNFISRSKRLKLLCSVNLHTPGYMGSTLDALLNSRWEDLPMQAHRQIMARCSLLP